MDRLENKVIPDRDVLLVEYQAAQDSAHHHDQLVWSITSILWASTLLLFGLVVAASRQPDLELPLTATAVLAVILTIYLWRCVRQLRAFKVQKYKRCVMIEGELGMEQHSKIQYPSGSQTTGYSLVMSVFLFLWLLLIVLIWVSKEGRGSAAATEPAAVDEVNPGK